MRSATAVTLLILAGLGGVGCDVDLLGPEDKPPDVMGSWVVSVSDVGPTSLTGYEKSDGVCTVEDFPLSFTKREKVGTEDYSYSGSHTGFTMICAGVTKSATEVFGMADTVVVVPPGDLTGTTSKSYCQMFQGCAWGFALTIEGFMLQASSYYGTEHLTGTRLGGRFYWFSGDTLRALGSFSAYR
jgi:hypothetical protein